MSETKVTQRDMFEMIADKCADEPMIVEFCEKKIAQLDKRKNAPRKPRFNVESNAFAREVYAVLSNAEEPMTNAEIREAVRAAKGGEHLPTAQRVAAALKKLKDGNVHVEDDIEADIIEVEVVINDEGKTKTFAIV